MHPIPRYYLSPCTPKSSCSEAVENPVLSIYLAKVPFVDRASRAVEPIDEWSSAELKAELKDLDLSTSGNKQELYDRLVEYEDDWVEDSESGISDIFGRVANIVVRNRVALGAVAGVLVLVSAIVLAGPVVIDMIMPASEEPPEKGTWEFTFEQKNTTDVQTYFINDDTTEMVTLNIPMPNNVSKIYIGAYWGEEDEQPGGIVGCDMVTVEVFDTGVSKPQLYSLSSTDASSQDCDADKTEPWDKIWYDYSLDIPNASGLKVQKRRLGRLGSCTMERALESGGLRLESTHMQSGELFVTARMVRRSHSQFHTSSIRSKCH